MASISTRGFTALCIYLAALLFFINTFTLATPLPGQPTSTSTPHAPCDDIPCIAGCLSDSHATQPASCSKNDPAKAIECLCATVASVSPKRVFAECVMECGAKEREIMTKMCATKQDDVTNDEDEDQDNGKNKEHKIASHDHRPKKHIGGATRVKDIASNDYDDDDDFDEGTTVDDSVDDSVDDTTDDNSVDDTTDDNSVDDTTDDNSVDDTTDDNSVDDTTDDNSVDDTTDDNSVDDTTDDDVYEDDDGDDDDDHPIKTPDVVTNINMEKDDDFDDDEKKDTVVINKKGDAYSMVASMKWTTIGAVGVAVLVMI